MNNEQKTPSDQQLTNLTPRRCSLPVPSLIAQKTSGPQEEGTITTAFDRTVLNDLDRFHLVMDTVDRLPQTGDSGLALKRRLADKLVEHKLYIDANGQDMPEIRNWTWAGSS